MKRISFEMDGKRYVMPWHKIILTGATGVAVSVLAVWGFMLI